MVKFKYSALEWDSQLDQDLGKTPHCLVGGWGMEAWRGIDEVFPNR